MTSGSGCSREKNEGVQPGRLVSPRSEMTRVGADEDLERGAKDYPAPMGFWLWHLGDGARAFVVQGTEEGQVWEDQLWGAREPDGMHMRGQGSPKS